MKKLLLIAVVIIALFCCVSGGKVFEGPLVLEVENFTLNNCVVSEYEAASQGKAVKFDNPGSSASFETTLPPGNYRISVYVNTRGPDEDGFYVTVNDSGQTRVWFNANYGSFGLTQFVFFTVGDDGIVNILLEAAEINMIIDRVKIESVSP